MKRIAALFLCAFVATLNSQPVRADVAPATPAAVPQADPAFLALLRKRIKHVFVIYQENRSFDSYFGTFPGAENLASPLAQTNGFRQFDRIGKQWVTPFRITASDTADANHARLSLIAKADGGRMDQFVENEEATALQRGVTPVNAQRLGLLTMSHEDCETIPYLWKYAHQFALFDHFFQAMYSPSTPGNIDLIAAQTGQTQWKRHSQEAEPASDAAAGVPVINDLYPHFGPYPGAPPAPARTQDDLTFATLFLTLSGVQATNAVADNDDVKDDISALAKMGHPAIPWGWYQEGFKGGAPDDAYVTHHNALQYFGYLRNNQYFWAGVHDITDLVPAIANGKLGDRGVIFAKGGYHDPFGFAPANRDPQIQKTFAGDDDHPGYSDSQVSEAYVATLVNAIANSKYWDDSLILITWDDSEGFFDHVSPPIFELCPDGHPCGDGPRVPAIVVSPFAKDHAIVTQAADHTSFAKLLGRVFDLPALASLPDEAPYLPEGPRDLDPRIADLTAALDVERLSGTKLPISKTAALIEKPSSPPSMGCSDIGVTPVSVPGESSLPPGFDPLLSSP